MPALAAYADLVLDSGTVLTWSELWIIELLRQYRSDANIRAALGMTTNQLIRAGYAIRVKLGAGPDETIRDAANRLEIPRLKFR